MKPKYRLFAVSLSVCAIGLATVPQRATAQFTQQFALQNSPEYEAEAGRLRGAPPREYDFSKALLSDVLRFLADDAGISFFGLPEGADNSDRLVTFSLRTSPFTALETLAKANGIALIHDNGLWYLRPADDTELIGRVYQINYNSQEMVTKATSSSGTGNSGGSSSGSSGGSGGGLSLQGATNNFEREPSKLIEDIKEILNLPTSGGGMLAPTISVDSFGQLSAANIQGRQNLVAPVNAGGSESGATGTGSTAAEPTARVIWNSDSNTLYVVATRQQHQWIEGYLASADQRQDLIAIEVKFFETNKDPSTELGLDWTGTLAGGYGANLNLPTSDVDLNRIKDYRIPSTAVLSYDDVTVRLRALANDRHTRTVSYPRMITLDNREVVYRAVTNQPVLASSSATSLGAGATETTAVDYLPIGTIINILPKRMSDDTILLNISIEVSKIIGQEIINGNPFPIATSRVYGAPVQIDSGFTVAISGLDEAEDTRTETGVPFLRRVPILGWAFKSRGEDNNRKHLMMFITPTILSSSDPGVPEIPSGVTANDPDVGPAIGEFEPTIMQYAEEHRPVPTRSLRTDYPDSHNNNRPATAAPSVDADSKTDSPTDYGNRTLVLAAPSRSQFENTEATETSAPTSAPAPTPAPAPQQIIQPIRIVRTEAQIAAARARLDKAANAAPAADTPAPVEMAAAAATPTPASAPPAAPPAATTLASPETVATTMVAQGEPQTPAAQPAAQPAAPSPSVTVSKPSAIEWDGDKPKGGNGAVVEAVDQLRNEMTDLKNTVDLNKPSAGSQKRLDELEKESQRLIDYVETQKHIPDAVEQLDAAWWDLVRINGQSKKLRESSIDPTGVATVVEEDDAISKED